MHDVLRARVMRKIESLPEEQVYQVLDYIEFLDSKYGSPDQQKQAGGFQRLAEGLEDGLRNRSLDPSRLREAFQVFAAADRAMSGVAKAGRQLFEEIAGGGRVEEDGEEVEASAQPGPEGSAEGKADGAAGQAEESEGG
ncbi:MAG: DUF2281 domain-containing protein [Gemmatimonadetes bacterium]|nr:DUF2281 domain-containing protein [Gemmatimonadota bacterium]MYK67624.1 DUF2281 domain-containing protein [Gemmatimonadota bacterium]